MAEEKKVENPQQQQQPKFIYVTANTFFFSLKDMLRYITDNYKHLEWYPKFDCKCKRPDTDTICKYDAKTFKLIQKWNQVYIGDVEPGLGFANVYEYETDDDEEDSEQYLEHYETFPTRTELVEAHL